MASDPTTRDIPLRNREGMVIANAVVDEGDFERVCDQGRWALAKRGYVYRRVGRNPQIEVKLHRFILGLKPGDPIVDHKDRNPLNNTRSNLRLATYALNNTNRKGKQASSSYRGVFWDAGVRKWRAQHTLNRKTIYLGIYDDEIEAAQAAQDWRLVNMPFSMEEKIGG